MEGTRGAVKNRFSFVSPLSPSLAMTESSTATVEYLHTQNMCGENKVRY